MYEKWEFIQSATVDVTGSATVYVKETEFYYQVEYMTVNVTLSSGGNPVNNSVATVFKRTSLGNITIDTTYTGNGDSSDSTWLCRAGQAIYGVWTGADVGASATLYLEGWRFTDLSDLSAIP